MTPALNSERNYAVLGIIAILGISLIYMSWIIFDGIMGAIIFFAIFRPIYIRLTGKRKWNSSLAALFIIFASFIILVVPFITLTWMVYDKIVYYEAHTEELGILKDKVWPHINKYISNRQNMDDLVNSIQSKVVSVFSNAINSLSNTLLQITVMYFLLYFMLKEHSKLEKTFLKYLPFNARYARRLKIELSNITYSNLLGQGFICLVQGLLVTIGFWIFGIGDAVFWGVVCFFLSFIPFIGSPLVFVPAGILQLYAGHTVSGIGIMIWGFLLVTNIDNVIRFYLAKRIGDIHPVITILGVIIGIPFFGILGLVYGPLLISYFILFIKIWEDSSPKPIKRK
jgi:predicted PurR-regulated permease PerM